MSLGRNSSNGPAGLTLKAWAHIVGGTGAILKSGGISGVTRSGTGGYTFTFTNNMASVNYVVIGRGTVSSTGTNLGTVFECNHGATKAVGSCDIWTGKLSDSASVVADVSLHVEFWE